MLQRMTRSILKEVTIPPVSGGCGCSVSERVAGMGCAICNPKYHIDMLLFDIKELEREYLILKNRVDNIDSQHK